MEATNVGPRANGANRQEANLMSCGGTGAAGGEGGGVGAGTTADGIGRDAWNVRRSRRSGAIMSA